MRQPETTQKLINALALAGGTITIDDGSCMSCDSRWSCAASDRRTPRPAASAEAFEVAAAVGARIGSDDMSALVLKASPVSELCSGGGGGGGGDAEEDVLTCGACRSTHAREDFACRASQ